MSDGRVVVTVREDFLGNFFTVSAQALCCYDFFLSFTREVEFMWGLRPSIGSSLYFTLRYPMVFNTIAVALAYLSWGSWQTHLICDVMMRLEMAGDALIMTSASIFTVVRIYVLSSCDGKRLACMIVLGLICPVLCTATTNDQYTFIISTPRLVELAPGYQTCDLYTPFVGHIVWFALPSTMMIARISAVIFDGAALLLTWLQMKWMLGSRHSTSLSSGSSAMPMVLMRDTAFYFGLLSLINTAGIIINAFNASGPSGPKYTASIVTWNAVLTSILLSRLILDLHDCPMRSEGRASGIMSTMQFVEHEDVTEEHTEQVVSDVSSHWSRAV